MSTTVHSHRKLFCLDTLRGAVGWILLGTVVTHSNYGQLTALSIAVSTQEPEGAVNGIKCNEPAVRSSSIADGSSGVILRMVVSAAVLTHTLTVSASKLKGSVT